MKNYYVYYSYEEWGRGYIGKRECTCAPEKDTSYFGSFTDKTFKPTEKVILTKCNSKEEALEIEIILHKFFEVGINPHFANKAKQTSKGFSFDFTGVKRPPKTKEHVEKHRKACLGKKWFYRFLEDDSFVTQQFKEDPGENWTPGRGPYIERKARKGLKWFHRVTPDGSIERKLSKEPPSEDWEFGSMPEGKASQAGTCWYSLVLPSGDVKYKMFREHPGHPREKGRVGFTSHSDRVN